MLPQPPCDGLTPRSVMSTSTALFNAGEYRPRGLLQPAFTPPPAPRVRRRAPRRDARAHAEARAGPVPGGEVRRPAHDAGRVSHSLPDFGRRDEERNGKASSRRSKRKGLPASDWREVLRKAQRRSSRPGTTRMRLAQKSGISRAGGETGAAHMPHSKNSNGWVPYRKSSIGSRAQRDRQPQVARRAQLGRR
jgi:hypothetical protein